MRQVMGGQESWVRRLEHLVLRVVSFVFSVGGAYAFASFFAPLDMGDFIQRVITVALSVALGLASYFLSRGIADRLMAVYEKEKGGAESVWSVVVFIPLFLVCEFLEIFTNYAKAIPAVHDTAWLSLVPLEQRSFHVFCTYLVYCVVPLVSPCLAVVDMSLERKKVRGGQLSVVPGQQPLVQSRQPQRSQGSIPVQSSRASMPPLQPKQGQPQRGTVGNPPPGVTRQSQGQGGPPGARQPQPELEVV